MVNSAKLIYLIPNETLSKYTPTSLDTGIYYFVVMLLCVLFVIDDNFDLIAYTLTSVPIGSLIGTIIAILINLYRRNNK